MAKVITIAQQKGGAGKTTIAVHLAVAFSQSGKKTAIIDTDPQASMSIWYKVRDNTLKGKTGLTFTACKGQTLAAHIATLAATHDVIIVDSPPHIEADAKTAIQVADMVILPIQPSPMDLWATTATIKIADEYGVQIKLLLNRVSAQSRLGLVVRNIFEKNSSKTLLKNQTGNRVSFPTSMLEGLTVCEMFAGTKSSQEIKLIIREISEALGVTKSKKVTAAA